MRRVVVSGIGLVCPLGLTLSESLAAVQQGKCGVQRIDEWDCYDGLRTRLGAPVQAEVTLSRPESKAVRSMGPASWLATAASEQALSQAGLFDEPMLSNGRVGIAYGSGTGSPQALADVCGFLFKQTTRGITGTTYHRMMSHTCAANIGMYFGVRGRLLPTSSACTSGSLAIGLAYEQIKHGMQEVMIAGGAEEFAPAIAAIFDTLYACSTRNDSPEESSRPFDVDRDGLVVGEGACTLILEEKSHAEARGVRPLAEIIGFGTTSDGHHITQPLQESIEAAMRLALESAEIPATAVDYINAHATGTSIGDITESLATANIMGAQTPISSLKGHLGHLLGASGAAETALSIAMLNDGWCCPTKNLAQVDPRCAELSYVQDDCRALEGEVLMSNTFAFGGVNTSILCRRI